MFAEVRLDARAGPALAQHRIQGFLLQWPRQGMRFMWSGLCIYKHLGCTSHMKTPSKWFYNIVPSCRSFFEKLGFNSEHAMKSACSGADRANGEPMDTCFLPKCCFSTLGLFAMLCRWSFAPNRRNGALSPESRAAAAALLQCFLHGLRCSAGSWAIGLHLLPE